MLPELETYLDVLETKHTELKDILAEIGDNATALNWKPLEEEGLSIFALAADVALQEDFWISHVVGKRSEPPGIDQLETAQGARIEPLIRLLTATQANTAQVLEELDASTVNGQIEFNGDLLDTRWCLLTTVQRVAENLGQINVMWQWWQQTQETIN